MAFLALSKLATAALLLAAQMRGASAALAKRADGRIHANMAPRPSVPPVAAPDASEGAVTSRNGTALPPYTTTYYFEQLIDHNNPSLGTFQQRYWHTYEFYEEGASRSSGRSETPAPSAMMAGDAHACTLTQAAPSSSSRPARRTLLVSTLSSLGAPPPESGGTLVRDARADPTSSRPPPALPRIAYTGYLTNRTINGQIAQAQNGSTIVLEHRYYGLSNPYDDLSVQSLQFHTIQQAIDDLDYFARNVVLPQPDGAAVKPGQAPWVLVGGSYSGALTSFAMTK